ncbi:hypothetical protein MKW98_023685 [Papaver atlanticum]|uniref:AB hydrolase-1 domain-containing protein n=1 Tax=Papaver atlanticum TaxID=357466 RepID=A0AAD4XMJ4_9MAGN|nr:hypothetical protein MKW98_023685 [Papaver atlanticum]
MDQIQHKYVESRGLKLHLAGTGVSDSVVVFLHGFPEIWYSWRHQMIAVAKAGYRAIAPDFRGYGLSEIPQEPEKASFNFGARPGYLFAILHPERVRGVVAIGVSFLPPGPSLAFAGQLPEGFYILRWQKPGRAEADFGRLEVKNVIRNIYILFSKSEIPIEPEDKRNHGLVKKISQASLYEKSGFHTALQVPYRSINEQFGMEQYISSEKAKEYVPDVELTSLPEGTLFAQEQFPEQVKLLIKFLSKHNHV